MFAILQLTSLCCIQKFSGINCLLLLRVLFICQNWQAILKGRFCKILKNNHSENGTCYFKEIRKTKIKLKFQIGTVHLRPDWSGRPLLTNGKHLRLQSCLLSRTKNLQAANSPHLFHVVDMVLGRVFKVMVSRVIAFYGGGERRWLMC